MVLGIGSGEVSAVTRLRMTSMSGTRMRAAWSGIFVWSLYLFVCLSGKKYSERKGEEPGSGRAHISQDTSSKQSPLHSKSTVAKTPLDKELLLA